MRLRVLSILAAYGNLHRICNLPRFLLYHRRLCAQNEELTFCDVCAGPGGFTEYVLWRREGKARGWGFTLKDGEHDFQPWKFNRQPVTPATFFQHYGTLSGNDGVVTCLAWRVVRGLGLPNTRLRGTGGGGLLGMACGPAC